MKGIKTHILAVLPRSINTHSSGEGQLKDLFWVWATVHYLQSWR